MKRLFIVLALLTLADQTAGAQGSPDPTFNGLVKKLYCGPSVTFACGGGYCYPDEANLERRSNARCPPALTSSPFWIDLTGLSISTVECREASPLTVTEVSEAGLNRKLYVKFQYHPPGETLSFITIFVPVGGGGYRALWGATQANKAQSSGSNEILEDRIIRGGSCEMH